MSPAPSRLASTRPRAPRLLAVGVASSLYSAGPPGSRTRTYPIGPSALISSHCFHAADELSGTLDSAKPIIAAVCEPSSRTGPPHAQGLTLLHQQRRHTRPGERPSSSSSSSLGKAVVIDFVVRAWRALMHVESVGACWSRITRASREKTRSRLEWTSGSNGCKTYIWRSPGQQEKLPESRLEDASGRRSARRGAARGTPRARAGRRAIRFARERGKARERVAIAACGAAMEGLELRLAALERSSEQLC